MKKISDTYKVTTKSGLCVEGTYVLDATGRIANVEDIGLEELGIKASRRGIEVDDHLRTSIKNIYASYDVTIEEAEKSADKYKIHSIPYGVQNEWVDNRELEIDMTLIVDSEGHLVGATIYGSEAGTWLDFLTLVINKKITGEELKGMIFAFPTQTFMIASLLIPILKKNLLKLICKLSAYCYCHFWELRLARQFFFLKDQIPNKLQRILMNFAAGAMLYVVVEELILEMSEGEHSNAGTIYFSIGFVLMMILDVALS